MTILIGKIDKETQLALCSHKFDPKLNKMLVNQLFEDSEPFPTNKYECEGENGQKTLNIKEMIGDFLNKYYYGQESKYGDGINQNILGACFGIAGPVDDSNEDKIATVSRDDWEFSFSESDFKKYLPCSEVSVSFINDMVAIGKSFIGKPEDDLKVLQEGNKKAKLTDRKAIMLVAGGLGQALWLWNDLNKAFVPVSSEGGHSLLAFRTEEEKELWLDLKNNQIKNDESLNLPICYEDILSEKGIVRIYQYLKGEENSENLPDVNLIIQKAIENSDPLANDTIKMFVEIMGARAGDLALTYEAKGGIYINDIIPLQLLQETFVEAFKDKEGKFGKYNENIPVKIYPLKNSVLLGAANHAVDSGFVTKGKFAYKRMNRGD